MSPFGGFLFGHAQPLGGNPMNARDFKRKLTAIFSADVAGYSRVMGEDEAATVKTLEDYKEVTPLGLSQRPALWVRILYLA